MFLASQEDVATFGQEEDLKGEIGGFSDSGPVREAYGIIEVSRTQSFIVPVSALTLVSEAKRDERRADGREI